MASLNATPEYYAAEERYRKAKTFEEKKVALEEMLRLAPKHKAAHNVLMEIKNKLAKLRKEEVKEAAKKKASRGGRGEFVRKQGFQIVLVGPVNGGKTALFNAFTGKNERSSSVQFETREAVPGAMRVKKVQIQVIDTPSITDETRGKIIGLGRAGDLVLGVFDNEGARKQFLSETKGLFGKIVAVVRGRDYDALTGRGIVELKERIFSELEIIRVFTRRPGGEAEMERPIALKKGTSVAEAAKEISKELAGGLKYAKVWGSAKFPGQQVGSNYELKDGDIVEFHSK